MKGRQVATGVAGFTPVGEAGECSIKCEDLQMSGESSALTERRGSFRKPFISFFITKSKFPSLFLCSSTGPLMGSLFCSALSRSRINN